MLSTRPPSSPKSVGMQPRIARHGEAGEGCCNPLPRILVQIAQVAVARDRRAALRLVILQAASET